MIRHLIANQGAIYLRIFKFRPPAASTTKCQFEESFEISRFAGGQPEIENSIDIAKGSLALGKAVFWSSKDFRQSRAPERD